MTTQQDPRAIGPFVGAALPQVAHDTPAAVLLLDLEERVVVYANDLAASLAPDAALPAEVDAWVAAADLRTPGGQMLQRSETPLERVARGEPVEGERLTAGRTWDTTEGRADLWVVGLPMTDAPPPLGRLALVVLIPVRETGAVAELQQVGGDLRHRAVVASELSFTISDPWAPDEPLVWVNPAFERATGYRAQDVLGHNCRFLQGPGTDEETLDRIRAGLRERRTIGETLLNYRADGTPFWNQLVISPVYDADGRLTHHVGVQTDVTQRVQADAERDRALRSARLANERLETLARISEELSRRLDVTEALAALPSLVVPELARWAFVVAAPRVEGVSDDARTRPVHVVHANRAREQDCALVVDHAARWLTDVPVVREVLSGQRTAPDVRPLDRDRLAGLLGGEAVSVLERLGLGRLVVVPLRARGRTLAVLGLVVDHDVSPDHLATASDVGVRAGLALDNARLYTREHTAALTLQRSLLPDVPDLPGLDVAAVYRPASVRAEVGGDWYDVLDLPGRGVGVAVGDVMGHDLAAAAAMGQLRSVLRSYAWNGDEPAEVVRRLDVLVRGLGMAGLATCVYARLSDAGVDSQADGQADGRADGTRRVTYSRAGHPPPLLVVPGRRPVLLEGSLTTPIGVMKPDRPIDQSDVDMPVGAALVLYTDGLLERRDRPLLDGLDELVEVLAEAPADAGAGDLCRLVVERFLPHGASPADDTCVLVVQNCPQDAGGRG